VATVAVAMAALLAGVVASAQAGLVSTDAGTGAVTVAQPNPAAARAAAQVAAVPTPKLAWKPCAGKPKYRCARVRVPLDYDAPTGATVSLSVVRRPADDPGHRLGSLFLNPGGPGGSGVQFVQFYSERVYTPEVREKFDLVSFDPRGIADSDGIQCFDSNADTQMVQATRSASAFPYTPKQERGWIAADRAYNQACVKRAGAIIDHMSTANVARDLDVLRRAVGDRQLTYAGFSYGSFIGSTYANLFPDRVRAIIVDGVIDPISWTTGRGDEAQTQTIDQRNLTAEGITETFQQFLTLCKRGGKNCAFSAGEPRARFAALTARLLKSGPVDVPDGKGGSIPVSYQTVVSTTGGLLNDPPTWPVLATFLNALDTGQLTQVAALLADLNPPVPGIYDQFYEGSAAVTCADSDNPPTAAAWVRNARASDGAYPYFGRLRGWENSACASWPGHDDDRYTGPFDVPTANPVLVMTTRYDAATRYQDAVSTSKILSSARLLTVAGWGHTTAERSRCATDHAAAYLLTGVLPPAGTVCAPDEVPFAAPTKVSRSSTAYGWID
jgi:pimeloyl-ACP methyl ester carboxylesterase